MALKVARLLHGGRRATCVSVSAVVIGLALALGAFAGESDQPDAAVLEFHISEQPLASALQAFSATSGVAVLYASGVETGQRSVALNGEFTREAALKILLGNSGLVPRYARSDAIALVDPSIPTTDADAPPVSVLSNTDMALDMLHVPGAANSGPDRAALSDYITVVQQDVKQALSKMGTTRNGSYRVGVDLWVDPARTILRTDVYRSTGDIERDKAVASVLQGVVIRQSAPARTPQPVRVMIVVRSM